MPKLKSDLHAKITALSEAGDDLAKAGNHAGAIKKYDEALALVPSPRLSYEAATWLLVAKGDVYFSTKKWAAAAGAFGEAVYGFGGNENPFVHLRFGQAQFELGSISRSLQSLARAFMLDGEKVFEDEDPRYLSFVRLHLKPPSGNKWPKAGLEVIADAAVAAELASKAEKETVRAVAARVARFVEKQRLAALAVAYQNGTIFDVPLLAARLAGEPVAWTPRDINHVGGDKLGLDDQPLAAVAGGLALVSPDVWADARSM
jgi:tetratricopeptide (TPR) repeat protein